MKSDPEQERQRLTRVYAAMSPEELQKLADDGASLTHEARETLKAEISGRGPDITLNEAATGVDVIKERDLVTIRRPELARSAVGKRHSRFVWNRVFPDRRQHGTNGLVHFQLVGRS
jgi:hypothetical protein